jgi:hypothetical protein
VRGGDRHSAGRSTEERGGRQDAEDGGEQQDPEVRDEAGQGTEEETAQGVHLVAQGVDPDDLPATEARPE